MIGVARVYSQQTNVLYNDITHIVATVKNAFKNLAADVDMPTATRGDVITLDLNETLDRKSVV